MATMPKYPFQVLTTEYNGRGGQTQRAHNYETLTRAMQQYLTAIGGLRTKRVELKVIVSEWQRSEQTRGNT